MVLIKHSITEEILDVPKHFLNCVGLKYILNNKIWFNDGKWKIVNLFTNKYPLVLNIAQPKFNEGNDAIAMSNQNINDKFNAAWNTIPIQIQNITFNKIYLSASNDTYQITDEVISYKNIITKKIYKCNYLTNAQHITSHDNNGNIKLWTISPSTIPPTPDYGIKISLIDGQTNITDWSNIDGTNGIGDRYNVTWIGRPDNKSKFENFLNIDDIKPHWEINTTTITYYGGLAKIFNALYLNKQNVWNNQNVEFEIYLDDNVVLPFGFSPAMFTMDISGLNKNSQEIIHNFITAINKPIIIDSQFSKATTNTTLTSNEITTIKNILNGTLSNYIKQNTPFFDGKIKITGGTINGYILKTSKFHYATTNFTEEYTYLSMPWFRSATTLRADVFNISANQNVITPYNFLRTIEYWIFYGLLELNATQIELNNISILCGSPRGISPVQLNGYVHNTIPPKPNTHVHINNCQFCLNHYGQTDGLDVLSGNIIYNSVYFQVADDTFKLNSKNIIGNDITIISGAAGGAINFHAYGTNTTNDISANIENIYIHLYSKSNNNSYTNDCANTYANSSNYCSNGCDRCDWWPGPAIIFAPVYPITKTTSIITVSGVYLNNYDEYNKNTLTKKTEPDMFMVGGWMNQLSKTGADYITNLDTLLEISLAKNQTFYWNVYFVYYNNKLKNPSDKLPIFLILKNIGDNNNNNIILSGIYNPLPQVDYIVNTNEINPPTTSGNINNQKWNINYKDKDKDTAQIQLSGTEKCLDIPGNYNIDTGYPSGYRLWIWDCSYAYKWNISDEENTKLFYYKNDAHESNFLYLNFDKDNIAVLNTTKTSFTYKTNTQLKLSNNNDCLDNLGGATTNGNYVGKWACAS